MKNTSPVGAPTSSSAVCKQPTRTSALPTPDAKPALTPKNQYATGQAQPGLSVEALDIVSVALPPKGKEQQIIAECPSTLDELIGAESQKLDALKTHKKGLMQQLFPSLTEAEA